MDVTVGDLLALEPRLVPLSCARTEAGDTGAANEREVSWAVSVRATPPHLPQLRGGEILMVPARVAAAVGGDLPALLREAETRAASAVVFDRDEWFDELDLAAGSVPLLLHWTGTQTADAETTINRLLTEFRGDLYRIGSDLERRMTDLTVAGGGLEALLRSAGEAIAVPLAARDALGRVLAAAGEEQEPDTGLGIERTLTSGVTLALGPAASPRSIAARFFADRIAQAAIAAMQRDEAARPRGSQRVEAVARLLTADGSGAAERRRAALALGLDPDGLFVVAVSRGASDAVLARALSTIGTILPAGCDERTRRSLIVVSGRTEPESMASRVLDAKRRWKVDRSGEDAFLALSAPASGVQGLTAAASEARFLAALQERSSASPRAVSFESVDDVGSLRLLFHLRDTNLLRQFVSDAIGPLQRHDRRGTLRATLRAFLESGGSQVEAALRLGIHRNTLAYRLRRIAELIGRDVADPGSWLTLHLALRAEDVIELSGHEQASADVVGRR